MKEINHAREVLENYLRERYGEYISEEEIKRKGIDGYLLLMALLNWRD